MVGRLTREQAQELIEHTTLKANEEGALVPPAQGGGGALALGQAKMLLNKSLQNDLSRQLELEGEMLGESYLTEDYREGKAAFQEKRTPEFRGR